MKKLCQEAWRHTLALLLSLLAAEIAFGQQAMEPAPPLWEVDPLGMGAILGPPCAANEDNNGSILIGDPLLDSGAGTPGLVAAIEIGIVGPHVENRLFDTFSLGSGAMASVHLPTTSFGIRGMPKVELGYRLGQAWGEVILSWSSLTADATQQFSPIVVPAFGPGGAAVRSRLNVQVENLDYASHEPITVFGMDMKWRTGAQVTTYYSDSQAGNGTLFQHVTDRYWGIGPHAMADFRRPFQGTGLDLFSRFDVAFLFGRVNQHFVETVAVPGTQVDSGQINPYNNTQVLTVILQAGVGWTPPWYDRFHVTAGYTAQLYQAVGTIFAQPSPTEVLRVQGGFVRLEWNY